MKQYQLNIYQPAGPVPPPDVLTRVMHDVHALVRETKAAGAWVFNGGLTPPSSATVVRYSEGEPIFSDGPFAEAKEHIGGFIVIRAADLDAALAWATKLSQATTLPIEVRAFQDEG
jgi:hypothetical protein